MFQILMMISLFIAAHREVTKGL